MPKVCLDPGHSGTKTNTGGWGYYESARMWDLHLLLKAALEKRGFQVISTRQTITEHPEIYTRGAMAKGCDCFLSLHSNACGTESVDRPVVFRAHDNKNNAEELALKLTQGIAKTMGTSNAGTTATKKNSSGTEWYGMMRGARDVGVPYYFIVEHSFHTNERASKWLLNDGNLQKLAEMEAQILADYYGMSRDTVAVESVPLVSTEGFSVGDTVIFSGNTHYVSANAIDGKPCTGGTAVVTATTGSTLHPVHIKGDKNPCTAYGWVDAVDIKKV